MPDFLTALLAKAYGDSVGPLGFPMRSEQAKELETLMKDLPKDCKDFGYQTATFVASHRDVGKEGTEDDRTDVSLITSSALDRDSEVLLPKGADWKQFLKNPVVPFGHDYRSLPVGKALWVKKVEDKNVKKDGWLAKTRYTTRPPEWKGDWLPDAVWHMVASGDLPGKSIGFIPTEIRPVDEKDLKDRPELTKCRCIISKYLVLEYSIAPVQSNPDALVATIGKARAKGIIVPDSLMESLGLLIPQAAEPIDFGTGTGQGEGGSGKSGSGASQKTMPPHMTEEAFTKGVQDNVMRMLEKINVGDIVKEVFARRAGKA